MSFTVGNKLRVLALLLLFVLPYSVFSQETGGQEVADEKSALSGNELVSLGVENCFDYYKFGSVNVQIHLDGSGDVYSGTEVKFNGQIINNNNYPIVSGSIYAKIFKKDEKNASRIHLNGYPIVDQFFAVENINIGASSTLPASFLWKVPLYATPGDYYIATYFVSDKKFNISGLSFTDDIIGSKYDFKISSEKIARVFFDKNAIKINGQFHNFATFIPSFYKDEKVSIDIIMVNENDTKVSIPVSFKLYAWDGLREENLVSQESRNIELEAGERRAINYLVTDTSKPVYFVVAELKYGDSKSVLDIRFARKDVDNTRINFVGPTSFPLKKGEPVKIYACMHSTGESNVVKNNLLLLEIKDDKNKMLGAYKYEGNIFGAIGAVREEFVPDKDIDSFQISAKLYKDDVLTDSTDLKYDCSAINKELCKKSNLPLCISAIFLVLFFIHLILPPSLRKKILFVFFFVFVTSPFFPSVVEAKSVSWNGNYDGTILFHNSIVGPDWWMSALSNFNTSIDYYAKITDMDSGLEINDGDSVRVGAKLKLEFIPFQDTDIKWNGLGYSWDSPYGHWVNYASYGSNRPCYAGDFVRKSSAYNEADPPWIYIPFNVNPPTKTISQRGTAGLDCSSDGSICTVLTSGTIVPKFELSSTYGKFYYGWDRGSGDVSNCAYNEVALREVIDDSYRTNLLSNPYSSSYGYCNGCSGIVSPGDFTVNIPAQVISYSLTALSSGNPPSVPDISHIGGQKNIREMLSFDFVSTDPDNDSIRYFIDWDADDGIDAVNMITDFVGSGSPVVSSKSWLTGGGKRIKAKAEDSSGNTSDWGYYSFNIDPCVVNKGGPCSQSNICGTKTGVYSCDGTCSALPPTIPSGYGSSCYSSPNSCGQKNMGTIRCDAVCSAIVPSLPINYGSPCISAPNSCGETNAGTVQCSGLCGASVPSLPLGYGTTCTAKNFCGMENVDAKVGCDGRCGPAPSETLCFIDSGVRIDQGGGDIVKIAAHPLLNPTSPVRVMTKNGVRSIPLVSSFSDPKSSKVKIMTKTGPMFLVKYNP